MLNEKQLQEIRINPELYYSDAKQNLENGSLAANDVPFYKEVFQTAANILPPDYEAQKIKRNLNPTQLTEIAKDPKAYLKDSYNSIQNNQVAPKDRDFYDAVLNESKANLMLRGESPEELLKKKNFGGKALEVLGNISSVSPNIVANVVSKTTTGKSIPIWSQSGGMKLAGNIAQKADPELESIIRKTAYGQPLTQPEADKYKAYKLGTLGAGLAFDIGADPLTYLGGGLTKLSKIKDLAKLEKAIEAGNIIKDTALFTKGAAQASEKLSPEKVKGITQLMDAVLSHPENSIGHLSAVKRAAQNLAVEEPKLAQDITKSINNAKSYIQSIDDAKKTAESSKIIQAMNKIDTARNSMSNAVRDIPVINTLAKTFVSQVPKAYKPVFDEAKFAKAGMSNIGIVVADNFKKEVKALAKTHGYNKDDMARLLLTTVENPVVAAKNFSSSMDKFNPNRAGDILTTLNENPAWKDISASANKIRDMFDNTIVTGAKAGVKEVPLNVNPKEWKALQNAYRQTASVNKFDPALDQIEARMRNLLKAQKEKSIFSSLTKQVMGDASPLAPEIMYAPHLLTKEAQQFMDAHRGTSLESLIDESIKNGNRIQPSMTHSSAKLRNPTMQNMTIEEANRLAGEGKLLTGFEGQFFKDNPQELIRARFNREGKAIEQAYINNGLTELIKTDPHLFSQHYKKGFKKIFLDKPESVNVSEILYGGKSDLGNPANIKLLRDKAYGTALSTELVSAEKVAKAKKIPKYVYVHKDVADAMETMNKLNQPGGWNSLIKGFDKIQGGWKRITLSIFPMFYIRNFIGNIANASMAGMGSKLSDWNHFTDALLVQLGKPMRMVTKRGTIYDTAKVISEAEKEGVIRSGMYGAEVGTSNFLNKAQAGVEDNARLALFLYKLKQGSTPKEAAKTVMTYLFDYSDLTPFEKSTMSRVMPFYTWTRKNVPMQIVNLFNPASVNIRKTVNDINNSQNDSIVNPNYQSDFLKDTATLTLNKQGQRESMMGMEGSLPQYDIMRAARVLSGKGVDEGLGLLSPLIKTPLEIAFNYDTFRKKPIQTAEGQTVQMLGLNLDPKVAQVLKNLRLITTANKLPFNGGDNDLSAAGTIQKTPTNNVVDTIALLTIGKPISYDANFSKKIETSKTYSTIDTEVVAFTTELKKLQAYHGNQVPEADIKRMQNWYNAITKKAYEAYSTGMLGDYYSGRVASGINKAARNFQSWIDSFQPGAQQ